MRNIAIFAVFCICGCATRIPKEALELRPDTLERRTLQTRIFDTTDEKTLLSAGASVLQDLGFTIEESESTLGVIVGSKERDATEAGQVVGAVAMAVLFGVRMPTDEVQRIRASLVTKPREEEKTSLRVTFQRVVWNTDGRVSKTESIEDPEIYQEFFDRLSKAVFLEAQTI
jgi:hypothetical protein